jgi:hypothetical protein
MIIMTIEAILTDALCTYTGISEFVIVKNKDWYSVLFEDGIRIDIKVLSVPSKELTNIIVEGIHRRYLELTGELGMNSK